MVYLKANINTPVRFISSGRFVSEAPWIHKKRVIDSFEIIIGINKTLYIQQKNTKYKVKPGEVLLLLPDKIHQGYALCEEDLSFYWVHFQCSGEHELIDDNALNSELSIISDHPESYKVINHVYIPLYSAPSEIERINILFQQLLHIANEKYYTYLSTDYLLSCLLIELSEQTITNFTLQNNNQSGEDLNFTNIKEWIRINATKNISATCIAEKFNYNKHYLSRLFKRKTGMNLKEYIHITRLRKATDLLSSSNLSIKEIANEVGFQDEKYFMRVFKKYKKMTPSEFRNAYYRTHLNNE